MQSHRTYGHRAALSMFFMLLFACSAAFGAEAGKLPNVMILATGGTIAGTGATSTTTVGYTAATVGVQRLIEAAGAMLRYLPPYSPDLNPIQLCFAKLKTLVRAARCRSIETLWPLLGECVPRFAPTECRNYFHHCGYSGAIRS